MKKLSLIFTVLGLLLISIVSFAGCGGDSGSINTASEDSSSSSIGTEEESSSSIGTITEEKSSSSGISSIGESSSSSSGVKPISEVSSSSSAFVSDGTCDSLITPFTRTYSSYITALNMGFDTLTVSSGRYEAEITIEVRKDSTFYTKEGYVDRYQNVSCETIDGELRIYSEGVYSNDLEKDVPEHTLISDTNGVWDMFSSQDFNYYVMGDSPYIDPIYWEQD